MPFQIIRNDITKVKADAIVNTANPEPVYGGGTDYAVYKAAGIGKLLSERKKIGKIQPGEAVVTRAFRLSARYIIHTAGPVWKDGNHGEAEILASCYRKSLLLASQLGCKSIAFPLISTGVYEFPKGLALSIALREISTFLKDNEMDVILVVFSKSAFDLSTDLVEDVRQFIDDHYVEDRYTEEYGPDFRAEMLERRRIRRLNDLAGGSLPVGSPFSQQKKSERPAASPKEESCSEPAPYEEPQTHTYMAPMESAQPYMESAKSAKSYISSKKAAKPNLSDMMRHLEESFQERLLRLIDERHLTDAEVYKKANVDRKLFSKIRCNPEYNPRKRTAIALAIALNLNLDETVDLLGRAGIALSPSSKSDLIVEYCIENHIYDIIEINALLFQYDQPMLGC